MSRRRVRHATDRMAMVAVVIARLSALVWLTPALLVNLDWSADASMPWNAAAAGSILASALFVEAAMRARSRGASFLFGAGAALLVAANLQVAFDNATHMSTTRSDHRDGQIQAVHRASSQRLQWSQERDAAVQVAGLVPTAAIRANIDRTISQNVKRWRSTNFCDPGAITAEMSIAFCAAVAKLRGQLAAAESRDQLGARIRELDRTAATAAAPTTRDPFADQAAAVLRSFGVVLPVGGKTALSAIRDFVRSLALELMAALGPSAWLLVVSWQSRLEAVHGSMRFLDQQLPSIRVSEVTDNGRALRPEPNQPFGKFIQDQLEPKEGGLLSAGAVWMAWQAWCAKEGIDPGSQKKFGSSMKRRFKHERNNNRPRYLDIALRGRMPNSARGVGVSLAKIC